MIKIEHIVPQPQMPPDDKSNLEMDKVEVYIVSEEDGTLWLWAFDAAAKLQ